MSQETMTAIYVDYVTLFCALSTRPGGGGDGICVTGSCRVRGLWADHGLTNACRTRTSGLPQSMGTVQELLPWMLPPSPRSRPAFTRDHATS